MSTLMPASGHGASAPAYSFASQPQPVSSRKKYRDPAETDNAIYRDLKETSIMWDKRVHRGNTYSMYTQNAIKEALAEAAREPSPKIRRRRKAKEPAIFDAPLPERERIPVDLTPHLVAKEVHVEVDTVDAQTDEFLPEQPPEQYQPQKTGIDAFTQVEDGELFNFDVEVEPILDVLVNKTLEQSIMEVEEEHELESMRVFKNEWYKRQEAMMKDWQAQVQEEWVRWEQKEAIVKKRQAEKRRDAQVLLKIQAMASAKQHLANLLPNAVKDLQEVAFPDVQGMAIDRVFLPGLLHQVQQEVRHMVSAQEHTEAILAETVRHSQARREHAMAEQRARHKLIEKKRHEELQIRRGKIRILVDDGTGGQVSVGPIQLSTQESIDEVQNRVYAWVQEHEKRLAAAWPHGVVLCINGLPAFHTNEIFEARAGQISMVAKPAPPPVEDVPADPDDAGDAAQ